MIYLSALTDGSPIRGTGIRYGVYRHPNISRRRAAQVELFDRTNSSFEGITTEASNAGRLRITRVGRQLYFHVAEDTSTDYRFMHSLEVDDRDVGEGKVLLGAATYDSAGPEGAVKVLWKRLTIRAEHIDDPADRNN